MSWKAFRLLLLLVLLLCHRLTLHRVLIGPAVRQSSLAGYCIMCIPLRSGSI